MDISRAEATILLGCLTVNQSQSYWEAQSPECKDGAPAKQFQGNCFAHGEGPWCLNGEIPFKEEMPTCSGCYP